MSERETDSKKEKKEIILKVADAFVPMPKLIPKTVIRDRRLAVQDAFGGMDGDAI